MKPMNRRPGLHPLPIMGILVLATPVSFGEERPVKLPDLTVVTAARSEQSIEDTLASVSVITRDDIRLSAAEDLPELLRLQAGVDVVRTGPAGAQTSVFLRGGNSDHVLVLIDGVRVASPHTGGYAWELLPLAAIERVEIVRGPRAVLYGSDAMSGVIQIFTRELETPAVRMTVGSFGSYEVEVGAGVENGQNHHALYGAYRRTDGFSAQNPDGFSFHPDDDGVEMSSIGANGEIRLEPGALKYRLLASRTETEFDQGESEAQQGLASLTWSARFSENWGYQVQGAYFDDRIDSDFGFFSSGFDARRMELGWLNQVDTSTGRLGFGLDLVDESGESNGSYDVNRDNQAAYLNWAPEIGPARIELGGRLDDNSQFGSEFTWQAGAGFTLFRTGQLGIQLGTAFRAPDFGELYSPGFGGLFAGNPALQPEQSKGVELNWRQDIGEHVHYRLSTYRNEIGGLIAFSGDNFQAVNINQADLAGVEIELTARVTDWTLSANATFQDTEDKATGRSLLRRPDQKASLTIDRHFGNGSWVGLEGFASGSRLDVGAMKLPGYGIISLRGGWSIAPSVTVELRLENVLDKTFEPASGFNGAGRSVFLSLDWSG